MPQPIPAEIPQPPPEHAVETSSRIQQRNERQTEMMQAIQQIQRDQHYYANLHNQGMAKLFEEMRALTHCVDAIQEYTQHVGLDPNQRGRSERARARARARRAQHNGEE